MGNRMLFILGVLLILIFASYCSAQQNDQQQTTDFQTQSTTEPAIVTPTTVDQNQAPIVPQQTTDTPTSEQALWTPDSSTPEGAVQVIRDYYDAINKREYEQAYNYWDRNGSASHQTLQQFEQGFDQTKHVDVQIGEPGREDAAAGSVFIEIPVSIVATMNDEHIQRYSGTYDLRRVNDVPGATAEQLSWHIYAANIVESNDDD